MANWLCSPAAAEQELFVPFPFQVTYCSSRWFAVPGSFPAATIDFLFLLSELPRTRSPEPYWLEIVERALGYDRKTQHVGAELVRLRMGGAVYAGSGWSRIWAT